MYIPVQLRLWKVRDTKKNNMGVLIRAWPALLSQEDREDRKLQHAHTSNTRDEIEYAQHRAVNLF